METSKQGIFSGPNRNRFIGFIAAVIVIALFVLIPPFEGLAAYAEDPEAAMASIGIFVGAIILFVFQVTPLAVSCLTLMCCSRSLI